MLTWERDFDFIQVEIRFWEENNWVCVSQRQTQRKNTNYGESLKEKLTGAGDNRNVAEQAEDLWAEEGTIPNTEKFVEKSL